MTIASQTSRIAYSGDGATTAFSVPFYFLANADIVAYLRDAGGNTTSQVLGTNYSLSGAGVSAGGTLTFTTAPASGYSIVIYRDPPITQTTSYNNNDPFPARSHELALDKTATIDQRTRDLVTRAVHLSDGDAAATMALPTLEIRKGKVAGYSAATGLPAVSDNTLATLDSVLSGALATAGGFNRIVLIPTHAALLATAPFAGAVIFLEGFYSNGDGGEGVFYWNASSASTSIPGLVVQPTAGGVGRWIRVNTGRLTPKMAGAVGDGTTDDRAAFANLSSYVSTDATVYVPTGTYKIGSNVTLAGRWSFDPGAILKPSASVTVILSRAPDAGLSQIFDLSAASSVIQLPGAIEEVWAEWWGAKGDNTKTDNQLPFQQAINALQSDTGTGGVGGGVVRAGRGIFLFSGAVTINNLVTVRGLNCRYTRLRANNATWNGQDTFWIFSNAVVTTVTGTTTSGSASVTGITPGTSAFSAGTGTFITGTGIPAGATVSVVGGLTTLTMSANATASGTVTLTVTQHFPQFNCRLEEVEIDCGDVETIQVGIYSDCWNEQCGLRNILLYRFNHIGVWFEKGYGGTATFEINQVEIFPGAGAAGTARGILLDNDATQTPSNVLLSHVVVGCDNSAVLSNQCGIRVQGLMQVCGAALHFENMPFGFTVAGQASIILNGLTGGTGVTVVFSISSGWTGRINCRGVTKGGATTLLSDGTTGYVLYADDHFTHEVIYPPDPTRGISACRVTSGASVYTAGPLVYSGKPSTGRYTFDITPALNASADFEVVVSPRAAPAVPLVAGVTSQTASGFAIEWRASSTAALTDNSDFYVELRHRP